MRTLRALSHLLPARGLGAVKVSAGLISPIVLTTQRVRMQSLLRRDVPSRSTDSQIGRAGPRRGSPRGPADRRRIHLPPSPRPEASTSVNEATLQRPLAQKRRTTTMNGLY